MPDDTISFSSMIEGDPLVSRPNIPLLRKMVEWAEEQEALTYNADGGRVWDQALWFGMVTGRRQGQDWCRTTCCIAGQVALLDGWEPVFDDDGYADSVTLDGETRLVAEVAARTLGLNAPQAIDLFRSTNSAATIRIVAERIAGERL